MKAQRPIKIGRGTPHGQMIRRMIVLDPETDAEVVAYAEKARRTSFAAAVRDLVEFGLQDVAETSLE